MYILPWKVLFMFNNNFLKGVEIIDLNSKCHQQSTPYYNVCIMAFLAWNISLQSIFLLTSLMQFNANWKKKKYLLGLVSLPNHSSSLEVVFYQALVFNSWTQMLGPSIFDLGDDRSMCWLTKCVEDSGKNLRIVYNYSINRIFKLGVI